MTVDNHELHIRSGRDIVDALYHTDPGVRLAILEAIAGSPDQVLKYGPVDGRDIIDILVDLENRCGPSERIMYLGALASFQDPRVVEAVKNRMLLSRDARTVLLCVQRLIREPRDVYLALFTDMLFKFDSPTHQKAAAGILADLDVQDPRTRLLIAVVTDKNRPDPPAMIESTQDLWWEMLAGQYKTRARRLCETQGPGALRLCLERWPRLDRETRGWLIRWGLRDHPEEMARVLSDVWAGSEDALKLIALTSLADSGRENKTRLDIPAMLMEHADPKIRRAYASAAPAGIDWIRALKAESNTSVKLALIGRFCDEKGALAAPELLDLLEDDDWMIRAAASRRLIEIGGDDVIAPSRLLINHPREEVRACAAQILMGLGQEEWLEDNVLL